MNSINSIGYLMLAILVVVSNLHKVFVQNLDVVMMNLIRGFLSAIVWVLHTEYYALKAKAYI